MKATVVSQFLGIKLVGSWEFNQATIEALTLLIEDERCRDILVNYVTYIRHRRRNSPFRYDAAAPLFNIDWRLRPINIVHVFPIAQIYYTPGYALTLAHEAYHFYLRDRQLTIGGWPYFLWRRCYFRNLDEIACISFELEVAARLGFPADIIDAKRAEMKIIPHPQICYEQRQLLKKFR